MLGLELVVAAGVGVVGGVVSLAVAGVVQKARTKASVEDWSRALGLLPGMVATEAPGGWIEASRYCQRRPFVARVRSTGLKGVGADWEFSVRDLGLADVIKLSLRPGHLEGTEDLVKRLSKSEAFQRALSGLFSVNWTIDRVDIADNTLSVAGFEHTPQLSGDLAADRERRAKTLVHVVTALTEVFLEVLELRPAGAPCPLCEGAKLVDDVGHLHESVCPHCHGRFLSPAAVQQVFGVERGMGPGELKEKLSDARNLVCPGCGSQMGPMLIDDKILDLCAGCGSMWLDKGELTTVSGGRYPENLGPIPARGG